MPSPSDQEDKFAHYREVTAKEIIHEARVGGGGEHLVTKAMAELREFNFGLTDTEYERVVGDGPDEAVRYERLCEVARWLVSDGTLIYYSPGEILRDGSTGWEGLSPPEEIRTYLDLLETGTEEDFQILKKSIIQDTLGLSADFFDNR